MSTARLLKAKGSLGAAAGMRLDIFNSFPDPQKKPGPPFSHSYVITGLGSRRGSTGLGSSWDRKPAQPPAIVVGKWVWRTSASRTPYHVRSLRYILKSSPCTLTPHAKFVPGHLLAHLGLSGCRSRRETLEYYEKIKISGERERESYFCRDRYKIDWSGETWLSRKTSLISGSCAIVRTWGSFAPNLRMTNGIHDLAWCLLFNI